MIFTRLLDKAKAAIMGPPIAASMKPENKALIKSLLDQSQSLQEDIYADSEQMLGTVPFILRVMARRPEFMIFSALKDFYALRPGSLDAKTAELLAVAAAAASGADKCLKVHMAAANRAGASEDEILDAVFIAAIIGQTRVLASALRTFQEFEAVPEKEE
jgi:AhpD family alkylhydroperoxidase